MDASPVLSINSSFSCNGVSVEKDQQAFANYQQILALLAESSAQPGVEVAFDIKMRVSSAPSEHPPLPASPPPELADDDVEPTCDVCSCPDAWQKVDKERGLCSTCAEYVDDGLKDYTEDFALASVHGKDAIGLFVLRQRAENCRERIADAAASYDGDLAVHDASLEEEMLNKRAAECLARLPASFAPWWRDAWTHEKWCQMAAAREAAGWALASADVPIVQRLAAMFVAEQYKVHEMKKAVAADCEKKLHDARRRGYADGYAFADQKWNPVYQAVCEELEAARKKLDDEVAAGTDNRAMRSDLERLAAENKDLQKKHDALLDLVEPTKKLMTSNPELFGGEAKGTSWPLPPATVCLPTIKEEDKQKALNFLKDLVAPSPPLPKSLPTVLPGIVEVEASCSQTEGLCCAWPIVEDQPTVCGAAGCIDCPPAAAAEPQTKPKPNYNHPNWPSPITKRFAKHLAKHSGRPGQEPKTIKTHQDALEFIAKRANISVEQLLKWSINHYQSFSEPWTLVKGSSHHFHMGTAPATWWC